MECQVKSYAKLNLGLEIVGKRPDGYHLLKSVFQTIDLYDDIHIRRNRSGQLNLKGNLEEIPWDERNIIAKVFRRMAEDYGIETGFDIDVFKRIPAGSGLGGGSSNGAVVLLFIDRYFQLNLDQKKLIEIGAEIGADIPFFLVGGTVLVEGIGEILSPIEDITEKQFGIVIPDIHVSTGLIFSKLNLTSTQIKSTINIFLNSGDFRVLRNMLEDVSFGLFPEIKEIRDEMEKVLGCSAMMSGSGSSLFSLLERDGYPESVLDKKLLIARSINKAQYKRGIGASPSGKAPVFGAGIRRFESSRPSKGKHE